MREVEMPKSAEPKKKRAIRRKKLTVTPDQIAERAYFLHLEGGPDPLQNWLAAERELVGAG
jgi:hypothetical protein